MKTKILITTIIAGITILINSCCYELGSIRGYGPSIDTTVNVEYVTGINIEGSIDVEVIPSDSFKVVIVAQENIARTIMIEVFGGVANVGYKPHINVIPTSMTKVVFYMPELYSLSIDGSGDIYLFEGFEIDDNFTVKINGSGDIVIDEIICNKYSSEINGSGDIEAYVVASEISSVIRGSGDLKYWGTTPLHAIRISGSGNIEAFELYTESTFVDIDGSGNAYVWAENLLDVFISGSGNVTYKGNPQLNIEITGSGNVNVWK
ncbi:MAG: DUF2807 domain-containing protein [Bacteroidales bacterium]|nr:DUF2807 domain-containing protein [Bacteroidales bacterium]